MEPLPRALAGATAITMDDTLWVFGGVKEEDFYTDVYNTEDYQSTEKVLEYYDYFVEETGNGRSSCMYVRMEKCFLSFLWWQFIDHHSSR